MTALLSKSLQLHKWYFPQPPKCEVYAVSRMCVHVLYTDGRNISIFAGGMNNVSMARNVYECLKHDNDHQSIFELTYFLGKNVSHDFLQLFI